jgi:hypothetical protein
MSRNIKNNSKKPYCKVCHDAGKPESEYTSHWVKDLTGKTTCPTLLDTECRYCYKLGHTAKFCDVLAKNNKEKEKIERRAQSAAPKQTSQKKKPQNTGLVMCNGFAALCDVSDSEEEVSNTNTIVNEYPSLGTPAKKVKVERALVAVELPKVQPEVKTGWAAIAAKPKEAKPVEVQNPGLLVLSKKPIQQPKPKPVVEAKPAPWANKPAVLTKSWADWSDSEDEDEDEIPDFTLRRCEEMPRGWSVDEIPDFTLRRCEEMPRGLSTAVW